MAPRTGHQALSFSNLHKEWDYPLLYFIDYNFHLASLPYWTGSHLKLWPFLCSPAKLCPFLTELLYWYFVPRVGCYSFPTRISFCYVCSAYQSILLRAFGILILYLSYHWLFLFSSSGWDILSLAAEPISKALTKALAEAGQRPAGHQRFSVGLWGSKSGPRYTA